MNDDALLSMQFPLPEGEKAYPFQNGGCFEILTRRHILLADDPGLGKTMQCIMAMNYSKPKRICIICPKVAVLVWDEQLRRFMLPDYFQSFVDDEEYEIVTHDSCMNSNLTIVNYEATYKWISALTKHSWDWVIVDECHYIKSPNAKRSAAVRLICSKAEKVIEISGSPILNYPPELRTTILPLIEAWDRTIKPDDIKTTPPLKEVWPQITTESSFNYRYTWGTNNKNLRRGEELQQKLRETFMIRRSKKEVLIDLPPKRRQVVEFKVEDQATKDLLEKEMKLFEGRGKSLDDVLDEIIMQANVAGTVSDITENDEAFASLIDSLKYNKKVYFEEMSRLRHLTALAKLPFTKEFISTLIDEGDDDFHMVVFGHHKDVMRDLRDFCIKEKDIKTVVFDGSTNDEDRRDYIHEFQNGEGRMIFIGGLKAVGISVTLTRANLGVFIEEDWSPANITQAEDRIHRIGSEIHTSVLYKHLVLENSLDAHIAKKHVYKAGQIRKILDRPTIVVKK